MTEDLTEDFAGPAVYAASFGQGRLWFGHRLEPDIPTYNVPWTVRIRGPLDLDVLQRAVDSVVERHEILRTSFAESDGVPEQIVAQHLRVPIALHDLQSEPESVVTQQLERLVGTPFELTEAPLIRVAVVRVGPVEHILVVTMHHAITDAGSYRILARELSRYYTAIRTGQSLDLPELPVQYGDYAEWQRDTVAAGRWHDQAEFWRTELTDWPLQLDLPADRPRPSVRESEAVSVYFEIPPDITGEIRALAADLGGTVHMVLMTAFQTLLSELSGQERFTVGTVVSGRGPAAVEHLQGFFVNTLPVKADCTATPTFAELFNRVRHHLLRAYANEDVPLDCIIDVVEPRRDSARTPLFQALFGYGPRSFGELRLTDTETEAMPLSRPGGCQSDLDLVVYDDELIQGFLVCTSAMVDRKRAAEWTDAWIAVIGGAVADPHRPLFLSRHLDGVERSAGAVTSPTGRTVVTDSDDPPRTELELFVTDLWHQVLGTTVAGVHRDFFDCGGDSLLAIRLLSRVEARTGRRVRVGPFLREPTIAGLAALLAGAAADETDPAATAIRPRDRPARASFGQQRLWFMQRLEPDSATYTVPLATRVRGALDPKILQSALDLVVARHEILRTCLEDGREDVPRQVVVDGYRVTLDVRDVESSTVEAMTKAIAEVAAMPFDVTRLPLLRVVLYVVGPDEHVLLVTMHHSITDTWSYRILLRELSSCYDAVATGREPLLPELSIQYGDFAEWQRAATATPGRQSQLDFWRTELAEWPSQLNLPTDRPRPPVRSSAGDTIHFRIPATTTTNIRTTARELGGTLHMVLMTAFQALLSELSGQEQFTVGTPVSGRGPVAVENLVGFFVNTLPIKADCTGSPPFPQLITRVRRHLLDAYANQDLPLEQIVEAVGVPRDLGRTPLFQAILGFSPQPLTEFRPAGTNSEPYPVLRAVARTDISVEIVDDATAFDAYLQYSTDLFDRTTINRFVATFLERLDTWTR